ncbi:heparan-sulfate 6-O-sulfotransferase 1-A-like isoform X3 [Dreissena polymorpha]|uniref:heparan-sulfate 6-O-sulfotransferase 1-A-like isoform X1 n=2 Tax=Dreissena polymorpha TaxID=45954 RepID=UPI0022648AF1|nr:heparan-sulfate 6-O-sulfotransferase 1-A-like isoform X1 [Dreissena polymorpha]XP_052216169.1 heparan-sulfate 6-O-sulfotransferase 1-A-like isoform X3 [Dreissena polymorpha]
MSAVWRRMNVIQWDRRRTQQLIVAVVILCLVLYFLLPTGSTRRSPYAPTYKVRHKLSHWHTEIQKNDTLFKLVTEQKFLHPDSSAAFKQYFRPQVSLNKLDLKKDADLKDFNIDVDVIVYLHIQKVGGTTFNNHLINDLDKGFNCGCTKDVITNPCLCKNKNGYIWLFSWFTVGWPCGLHADWTMLHECIDTAMNDLEEQTRKRRYFYITLLRDPVSRYLSEWQHQRLGQHWEDAKLQCGGKRVELFDIRPCFYDTWHGVSLDEFMECRDNLAVNRQTRMIADLTKSNCYYRRGITPEKRAEVQLESAKQNLQQMPFFGLTERQTETQHLFEKMFGRKFKTSFTYLNDAEEEDMISEDEFVHLMQHIELDMQLYLYAAELFKEKLRTVI